MNDNIIECRNLTHFYGKRMIYRNLSFNVPKGRILGLLGKNGTGKTTTINLLSGYLKPREGECRIFNTPIVNLTPKQKSDIGLLIEGHVQYQFMNIEQIEKFYSSFFPNWKKEAYYELMGKLKVAPRQRISRMSCGQRSQVALGLILAQDPELIILDDFSLGLDPGYRRLFVEYLKEYAVAENKTIFLTSHIIQDMERLVDDCIILDYGKILIQCPVEHLLNDFKKYTCNVTGDINTDILNSEFYNPSVIKGHFETYSFLSGSDVCAGLNSAGIDFSGFKEERISLEDAFIGLTGKY